MTVHKCNPSTQEVEAGRVQVQSHPRLNSEFQFEACLAYVRPCLQKQEGRVQLERWLSPLQHLLLLQKTQVWFPAPTWRSSQTFVTAASWDLLPLGLHWHLHSHTYVRIIKNKLKKKSKQKIRSKEFLDKPGVVAHTFNLSTWEAEAGGLLSSRPVWSTE